MRLRSRLRSQKGVTLMEMIVAAGVLAVLALMLNTGLMMAQNSYYRSVGESESQMLLSTLSDLIARELRYARDVVTEEDGTLRRYTSANYGRNTTLSLDSQGSSRQMTAGCFPPEPMAMVCMALSPAGSSMMRQMDCSGWN